MLDPPDMSAEKIPVVDHYMTRIPYTVGASDSLADAHKMMRKHKIHHLPVTDSGELVGIVSMRDLYIVESLPDVDASKVPVEDAMSRKPYTAEHDEPIDKVAAHMAAFKIGSAVVIQNGEIAGIFTTHDALVALVHLWKRSP